VDFANERYIRVYTRNTTTLKLLGFDGRAVLWHILREMDRSGVLDLGGLAPWEAAMLHSGCSEEVARAGIDACLKRECLVHDGDRLVAPRYIEANETPQSDKQRAKESRERRAVITGAQPSNVTNRDASITERDATVTERVENVTPRHTLSHGVTPCLAVPIRAEPCLAVPSLALQAEEGSGVRADATPTRPRSRRKASVPKDPLGQQLATSAAWDAYRVAYLQRYGDEPLSDAKTRGQIKTFVSRVGAADAPHVIAHYLRSRNAYYVQRGHSFGCLLADAQKLKTEWATGKSGTQHQARADDKLAGRGAEYEEMFERLRLQDEADAKRVSNGN
jgi:hypothetical protein